MSMGILIGLALGLVFGILIVVFLPNTCWHHWGSWKEVRGLHVVVRDEFGGKTNKVYRRFERRCNRCGKYQLSRKKTA